MKCHVMASALILLSAPAALAQTDPMQAAHVASANQLGLMEYCQSKGWADQAAVDAEKASAANLPPTSDTAAVTAAEATGKNGSLLNNGQSTALSGMASQTNTTEQALCTKMADSAKMVAEQLRTMPQGMPGMPGMTMPAMPAMPNGMTMPGMPKPQ